MCPNDFNYQGKRTVTHSDGTTSDEYNAAYDQSRDSAAEQAERNKQAEEDTTMIIAITGAMLRFCKKIGFYPKKGFSPVRLIFGIIAILVLAWLFMNR